jgi:predicted RNA-binding Zn ribbon-like protein
MKTPSFDAGSLALDLLNTDGRLGRGKGDDLQSPESLLSWLDAAGLLPEEQRRSLVASPPEVRMLLVEAHRLRHTVLTAVTSVVVGLPLTEGAVTALNRFLRTRARTLRLAKEGGGLVLVEEATMDSALAALAPVAEDAVHLVLEGDPSRMRQCHADGCGRWFLDTARNGRRKWCSMSRCGNRAKVAAHYRRHRAEGSAQEASAQEATAKETGVQEEDTGGRSKEEGGPGGGGPREETP